MKTKVKQEIDSLCAEMSVIEHHSVEKIKEMLDKIHELRKDYDQVMDLNSRPWTQHLHLIQYQWMSNIAENNLKLRLLHLQREANALRKENNREYS